MGIPILNTLQYAKSLQAVGFSQEQAEAIAEGAGVNQAVSQDFATKRELYEVRDQLNQKIDEKFSLLDEKFKYLDSKVSHLEEKINCMADLITSQLFNRLGGLMVACMSISLGLVTLMFKGV